MKYLNTFERYNGEAEMDEGLFSFIGTLFSNPKKKRELDKLAEELFRTRVEIGKLKLEGDPIEELEAELSDKSDDFTTSSNYDSKESAHGVKIELLETKEEEIVQRMDEIGEENEKLAKYVGKVKLESRMRSTEALMRVADTEVKKVLNKLRQKDQQSIKKVDKELVHMKESWLNENEETYKDYPVAAKANAKKAIDWKEKHGRDEVPGGTEVGWARAHQLAKGEALSRDVVSRMAQFNRHRKNSGIAPEHKDEPWKDNGHIAWLIWGGDEGVDWAMKKMDQIKKEEANESTKAMKHVKMFEAFINENSHKEAEKIANQITDHIQDMINNDEEIDGAHYLVKDYFEGDTRNPLFNMVVDLVDKWMKKNKI
jgi:hypothetical protein